MRLGKYSMGIGDRFGRQGVAQLAALQKALASGIAITPVWNKSHREHSLIGTSPGDVRTEADQAVKKAQWQGSYFVDADHIGLKNVDLFMEASDFFTIDVADFSGQPAEESEIASFVQSHRKLMGRVVVAGIPEPLSVSEDQVVSIARKYLLACQEAGKIYRHIESTKGKGAAVIEVSMDETDLPQTPVDLLFILAALADLGVPAQTLAPKFTGRFNKGVDYVGDLKQFAKEFEEDLAVIRYAIQEFGLPDDLKLSVHSGSDKFSIYGIMGRALKRFDAGIHVKTAGTTWLEEVIGLAMAGGEGLSLAQELYAKAHGRLDELAGPYAKVLDIDRSKLPSIDEVNRWSSQEFADALRHTPSCPSFDPNVRQLMHVGYKVAAEMGDRYLDALSRYSEVIAQNVTENLYDRHVKRIFH